MFHISADVLGKLAVVTLDNHGQLTAGPDNTGRIQAGTIVSVTMRMGTHHAAGASTG